MKKHLLFKIVLALIPITGIVVLNSFSSGNINGGFTGSPGDGATCTTCHAPGADFGAVASITTNVPVEGYTLGQTYEVVVSINPVTTRYGFQITAENETNNKVGTWAETDGFTQVRNVGDHVSHTFAGSALTSWTMEWTAPDTDEGTITFYAAVNAASNAGDGNSNDQIVTTSLSISANILSAADPIFADLSVYPNPVVEQLRVHLPTAIAEAKVVAYNYLGKEMLQTMVDKTANTLDVSRFQEGIYILAIHAEGKRTVKTFIKK